jgi:hypothetical protein
VTLSTPELQECLGACRQRLQQALLLSVLGLLMLLAMQWLPAHSIQLAGQQVESRWLYALLPALVLLVGLVAWGGYLFHRRQRRAYAQTLAAFNDALQAQELPAARHALDATLPQARKSPLTRSVLDELQPRLDQHLDELTRRHLYLRLLAEVARTRRQCQQRLEDIKSRIPLIKAETTLRETCNRLQKRREQLSDQWDETYEKFSWWNKLKYSDGPNFSEIDQAIKQLNFMHRKLKTQHAEDFARLDAHFSELNSRAESRITASQKQIEQFIAQEVTREQENELPLKAALWLSALSVPVSLWDDFSTAGNIYDALRSVNGNYAGMSDAEIWLETLFLPAEQLAGLASLTKGAYFEQLVAADTGGTLFEHFNNPGTDIIIDGQVFQLKATTSAAYVNSVDAGIPVIATSEVAEQTRAIDALLTGVGGLGFFATIQGINHAGERYKNGGDGVEALFEGAGVALEGTARALVGTAELGFKALNSRPSQFIGRTLLAGLKKLDDKMMEAGKKPE